MSDRSSKTRTVGSRLVGLFGDDQATRRRRIEEALELEPGALEQLSPGLSLATAELMIENVIGLFQLPMGIATNFVIDGRERLLPLVIEEPSVVAAASNGAKMARAGGGFITSATDPVTIVQVELRNVSSMERAIARLRSASTEIATQCDVYCADLVARGGGFRELELRPLDDGTTLVVHLLIDCRDAMGANTVNTVAEAVSARLAELSGGVLGLRIISNLADRRLVTACCTVPTEALRRGGISGEKIRDGVIAAGRFANLDPYRAVTHNKGVMNGVDAVILATANDWRAVEAGAHAYAARSGQYRALSEWSADDSGALVGRLELPLAVGIVGGATKTHPVAQAACEIMQVSSATDLARVAAAAGLATNLAALKALSAEGIQEGHMALHRRSRARRDDGETKEG